MYRSDDPGGVELRLSILSIYARGLVQLGRVTQAMQLCMQWAA